MNGLLAAANAGGGLAECVWSVNDKKWKYVSGERSSFILTHAEQNVDALAAYMKYMLSVVSLAV